MSTAVEDKSYVNSEGQEVFVKYKPEAEKIEKRAKTLDSLLHFMVMTLLVSGGIWAVGWIMFNIPPIPTGITTAVVGIGGLGAILSVIGFIFSYVFCLGDKEAFTVEYGDIVVPEYSI